MRWGCQRNNQRSPKTLLFVFKINVQNPPRSKQRECSISFYGKSTAEFNADMCLFLEQWEDKRSELRTYNSTQVSYRRWREQTLVYYFANAVECTEPEELDRDELIARRTELLEKEYGKNESFPLIQASFDTAPFAKKLAARPRSA